VDCLRHHLDTVRHCADDFPRRGDPEPGVAAGSPRIRVRNPFDRAGHNNPNASTCSLTRPSHLEVGSGSALGSRV